MNKTHDISNRESFKSIFNLEIYETVLQNYISMISEFLLGLVKKIHIHDTKYYIFVIQRGLETLKHCFKIMYLYTKNADLSISYCKKALCYYIEFMGQIGEDSNSFLQLNSKDAALFVYKKTIFEIDNDFRKDYMVSTIENDFLSALSTNIDIFGEIVMNILYLTDDKMENRVHTIVNAIGKSMDICSRVSYTKNNIEKGHTLLFFITTIKDFVNDHLKYSEMCNSFAKKYKTKTITTDRIHEKLYRNKGIEQLNNLTTLRFINWIFN